MKFMLYHLVIIDDGTPFRCVFTVMCDFLQMKFAVFVERFYRFFNKIVTIVSNDRDTISIFAEDEINVVFSWNSVYIDGTNIIRSIPAIGRK